MALNPYNMTDDEVAAAVARLQPQPTQMGVTSVGGRPVVPAPAQPTGLVGANGGIGVTDPYGSQNPLITAATAARAAGSNSGPLAPGVAAAANGVPGASFAGTDNLGVSVDDQHGNIFTRGVGAGTRADIGNLGTIAQGAGNYAAQQAAQAQQIAQGVQAGTQAMATQFGASGNRAVPALSVLNGADPTAQQGSTLSALRAMDPSAAAAGALAATQGADVSGAARSALSATNNADVTSGVNGTLGNIRTLDVTSPSERALTNVQSATPQAPATSALDRLRSFDSAQPSAAQAMLADQSNREFANSLALARTGGTATERAWNLSAANAQNFERNAQLGRTTGALRATEQRDQKAQELQALQSEGALATNIGQLDLSRLGLESSTAQGIGQLGLGRAGLELQGASTAGELALQKLVAGNNAAANVGQLDLGKLQAGNAAAANVGQLQLGRSAQELQAAQGVDATQLQAGTAQASLDAQLQQMNDQFQLENRQLAANTYLQGSQLGLQGQLQGANLGLTGYQIPYQAQQDILANARAEADQNIGLLGLDLGQSAQRAQLDAQRAALPWQVAAGAAGPLTGIAMTALSDKRSKTAIERLRDEDVARDIEATPAYRYKYKAGTGEDPELERLGSMVQDIERTRSGRELVAQRPDGFKGLRLDRMVLQHHAVVGSALRRLRTLEQKAA